MKKYLTIVAFLAIVIVACTHKPFLQPSIGTSTTTTTKTTDTTHTDTAKTDTTWYQDTSVCFQRDVLPIFISKCTQSGCHDAVTQKKGYNLTSYATIIAKGLVKFNSGGSKLYTECVSGKMPKSPTPKLDSTELSFIRRWIDKGAPDDTDCAVTCDTIHYTFATAIKPILNTYCYGCHATSVAASAGGSIILDTYTGVQTEVQNGKLMGDLNHTKGYNYMPLGGNKLPDCKITQIQKWITAGALNN